MLRDQVEEIVLEEERQRVDREALAHLEPADADLVREILGGEDEEDDASDEWDDVLADVEEDVDDMADDDAESEVERLLREIEESRVRQRALERFVAALGRSDEPDATVTSSRPTV